MSDENLQVVRRIFDSWADGDFRGGADELDPYVTFVVRPPLAEPAVRVGPQGVRDYMREFLRQWKDYMIEAKDLKAVGDTILVSAVWRAVGRASGVPMEVKLFMLFTFRGRRIVRMESIAEKAEAFEAVGLHV